MRSKEISVMYSMKPHFEQSCKMEIKTTMYGMKNLQFSPLQSDETTLVRKREILVKDIEERQAIILQSLADIKSQMATLREGLMKTDKLPKEINIPELHASHEIVINANVNEPPYSLLAVSKLWKGLISLKITNHIHSSLKDIPPHLKLFENTELLSESNISKLKVRLVWKNVETCEFIISPIKYLPLKGEVNILRFFHYCFSPTIDEVAKTQMDSKLDLCHQLQYCRNGGEVKMFIQELTQNLQKSSWLFGREVTIVDVAAWSALKKLDKKKDLSKPVKIWFEECEKLFDICKF